MTVSTCRHTPYIQQLLKEQPHLARGSLVQLMGDLVVHVDDSLPPEVKNKLKVDNYEHAELRLADAMIEPNDRVLEIGCGIGVVAIACARICGDQNVTCYEANPRTADLIERNFALNGMKPRLRQKAIATHCGTVQFYTNDNIVSSSLIDRDGTAPTNVPCDDIRDVIGELDPNVIVMDAEGAEVDLLRHADLSKVEKLLLELHPAIVGQEAIDELSKMLDMSGFECLEKMTRKNVSCFVRRRWSSASERSRTTALRTGASRTTALTVVRAVTAIGPVRCGAVSR